MNTRITEEFNAGVLHLKLNRPEARNAIDDATARELGDALAAADHNPEIKAILLSGTGGGFCAGLDLKAFTRAGEIGEVPERGFAGITKKPPRKPVVAAVEGFALAGGFEIALACDFIVAARDSQFGLPEVKRGLVADGGALLRLPERMPIAIAMEIAMLGEPVSATLLHRWGIVNRLVDSGDAVSTGHALARQLAALAPMAVVATKEILSRSSQAVDGQNWDTQTRIARPVWTSRDAQEGATAFAERRAPIFRGY